MRTRRANSIAWMSCPLIVAVWCLFAAGRSGRADETIGTSYIDQPTLAPQSTPVGSALADLEAQVQAQQAALEMLQHRLDATEHRPASADSAHAAPPPIKAPTYPNAKLSGFFHLDHGNFSQDAASQATLGDIQDGIGFRRARLAAIGSLAENVNYSIEVDFATAGRPSFMDVWAEVTKVPWFENVRFGQFRQPFSMDAMTSVRQLQFLERALPFQALVPFRRVGLMAYDRSADELTTWAYSVFRTAAFNDIELGDTRFATNLTDAGDYSFSTRATHLLWYDEPADGRYLLHVGGGYDYSALTENPTTGQKIYRASSIPEFFVGDPTAPGNATALRTPNFVDTGNILADDFHLFGAELAGVYGPLYFQAEYMQTIVNQTGGPALGFEGAYLQIGWFLTGEHRPYNRAQGIFDRLRPFEDFFSFDGQFCGCGAWELALRWSYIDLNSENVAGGKLNDVTIGVNWYLNPWTRLQFNYIRAMADSLGPAAGNTDIYALRWQADF